MKYIDYLQEKNLSNNTIQVYLKLVEIWVRYLSDRIPTKLLVSTIIKEFSIEHASNTTRLLYHAIRSYLKFQKNLELLNEIIDIKLPSTATIKRTIISLAEFENIKKKSKFKSFYQARDWRIFVLLFTTGIRAHEIGQIKKSLIIDNRVRIIGKGNRCRTIYLSTYMIKLLNEWDYDQLNVTKMGKVLSYKQINHLINNLIKKYFNLDLHPHDLRRSFATNLIRQDINIKIISELLGHVNINTTSRYIHLTEKEISEVIEKIF